MNCKLCGKNFDSLRGLHSHIARGHTLNQEAYYHQFYPRFDKHTGDLIVYKDHSHYFESDFNSRENFAAWLAENYNSQDTKSYVFKQLQDRLSRKNTNKLPSQIELKSIFIPVINGFDKICGGMGYFLQEIRKRNICPKFDYLEEPKIDNSAPLQIFEDTREQMPLKFSCKVTKMKLSAGDYGCAAPYYSDVFIERKSLADLAGTLGGGRERFEREIERAKELGFYLVVVIEDVFSEIQGYSPKHCFGKRITGAHLTHEIREIMTKHDHIQFVCAGSRKRAAPLIENIFRLKEQVRYLDLEYLKDTKRI